jgi:hypothetical protein
MVRGPTRAAVMTGVVEDEGDGELEALGQALGA